MGTSSHQWKFNERWTCERKRKDQSKKKNDIY